MALSNKARQQILRQQMIAMFPYFIEISLGGETSYFVNADEDKVFGGRTYTACAFSIKPPDRTESSIGDGKITFSAIYNNREFIKKVRMNSERGTIRVVGAIVYSADGTDEGTEPIFDTEFMLTDASWNDDEISWTMRFDDGMAIVMPCDVMDEIVCPGVV